MGAMDYREMRCLKIRDKWIKLILNGSKTWEIRRTNTKIRERIALGNMKTKCVEGYCTIVDSKEIAIEDLKKHNHEHQANDFLDEYAQGRKTLFAWVLEDVKVEPHPKPYTHATGSWCRILT